MITPRKKLFFVLTALFISEAAVMALINLLRMPDYVEAFLDASVLILVALPILYVQFVQPMVYQYQVAVDARRTAETLLTTSMELAQSLELNDVIDILLKRVQQIMPFDFATVYLLQSPAWLAVRAVRGYQLEAGDEGVSQVGVDPRNHPTLSSILTHQKSLALADVQLLNEKTKSLEPAQTRNWVGIPLIAGGKVIGVCGFGKTQPEVFHSSQVQLAEGLVRQAAVAIQNARLFEQVRVSQEQMQNLTHKTVEVQEKERRLIARDLYDDVGQEVVTILLQLRVMEQNLDEPVRSSLGEIEQELTSTLEKLHTLAFHLRPACLDHLGLMMAIRQDVDKLCEENGIQGQFETCGLNGRLPERVETILYRIVQEALENVARHAQATRVNATVKLQDDELVLMVEDDGVGFRTETVDQKCCLGLLGMRERAEMIGGELLIESSPGNGTTVMVTIPYLDPVHPAPDHLGADRV